LIITCEQCATQFQLADAKVPAGGVRVRCSRCKHAFFVEPAAAGPELEPADRAAQEALDAYAPPAPEATDDLSMPSSAADSDLDDSDDPANESDWEFAEAPFGAEPSGPGARREPDDAARATVDDLLGSRPASRAAASDLASEEEDLGSPESWDLLAGDSASAAGSGGHPASEFADAGARRDPAGGARLGGLAFPVAEWLPPSQPSVVLAWIARMGHAIGWSVTAILISIVAFATLAPPIGSETQLGRQALAELEAREISGRWVENAVAGSVFVVSGQLANPTAAPAALQSPIGVRLLDANGARLPGEAVVAGPVLMERELREADPAGIQARQAEAGRVLAAALIQPGESLAFEAVVGPVPLAAARFALEPLAPGRKPSPAAAGDPSPAR